MERMKHFLYVLFPKIGSAFKRLIKKPITNSFCDVAINVDPLWNHVLKADQPLIDRIQQECNSGELLMSFHEAVNLIWAMRSTREVSGEMAEVGSFSGASANLILDCCLGDARVLNLFDTFEGIPEVTIGIDKVAIGEITGVHLSEVKLKLSKHAERIKYHVGIFPDTLSNMSPQVTFSFINLDADTYSTTHLALSYFYSKMSSGGMIICHDYSSMSCPGVRKAIDEFFSDKVEIIIPLWHTQALIVKA